MPDFGFQWVDWAIVIVVLLSVLAGLSQGFFRSVFSLGGLVVGLMLASWNYSILAGPLVPLLHSEQWADVAAFLIIALVVMAIAGIIGVMLSKTLRSIGLGCLDRLAGGVFGFFQGILLVTLFILAAVAFYPQARWLMDARLPRHFFAACHLSTQLTPGQLAERVKKSLKMLEGDAPEWMHPNQTKT